MSPAPNGTSPSPQKKHDNKLSKKHTRRTFDRASNTSHSSFQEQLDFEQDGELVPLPGDYGDPISPSAMHKPDSIMRPSASSRRTPLRMDAQDGPWSVSVAESPHDLKTYSLYVKSSCFLSSWLINHLLIPPCFYQPQPTILL